MKSFLKTLCAVLLANLVLLLLLLMAVGAKMKSQPGVKDGAVLIQELNADIPEFTSASALPFDGGSLSHTAILENLEKARHDKRIKAVVLKIGSPALGMAKQDELKQRIRQLQDAHKPVWAYTEGLERSSLLIGSACDSLFLMKNGYVSLTGFASSRSFFRGTLEKLGIKENMHRIEKYKSAAEMVQRDDISPESRANIEWMLDVYYPEYLHSVESGRRLAPGTMESSVLSQGTLTASEALGLGLVDRLVYWDELESSLLKIKGVKLQKKESKNATGRPIEIAGGDYAKISREDTGIKGKRTIAVVHAQGVIGGETSGSPTPFGTTMGSQTMDEAFRSASANKDVAAIIFRIDSGGGESTTSWKIQRSALQAAAKKPMVVSICDMAASGGYLIGYPCGTLVADRLSVVGSIGSISGKFNMRGLYDKLGMTMDFVTRGPNALMNSDYFDYTPKELASFKARHWADYEEWVTDIARARHKQPAEIDSIGRGRVWTGQQALERGLIDSLGTFDAAVRIAKAKAGIPADQEVKLLHYPKKAGTLEALRRGGLAAAFLTAVEHLVAPFQHEGTWAVDWNTYR